MKKLLYFYLILSFISCGKITPKGKIQNKKVPVSEFSKIQLTGKFRAFYVRSDSNFVLVETYPNIADNLKINVKDKNLNLHENRPIKGVDFYNVTIYSKYSPTKIAISDSVEMNISSEIKTDNFQLNLKNNAKFIGSINTRKAEISMQNLSTANFLGKTKNAYIKITDTAGLIAPYWLIDNLTIDSSKGNYAEVHVKDSIKGEVKNTAKFLYYNDPIRAFKIDKNARVENKVL